MNVRITGKRNRDESPRVGVPNSLICKESDYHDVAKVLIFDFI